MLSKAGGVGKVLPKPFCSWKGRARWHLFTSSVEKLKTFSRLQNSWKREPTRLSIIHCFWFQNFFFSYSITVYLGRLARYYWGECPMLQIKIDCSVCTLPYYFYSSSVCIHYDNLGLGNHRSPAVWSWSQLPCRGIKPAWLGRHIV